MDSYELKTTEDQLVTSPEKKDNYEKLIQAKSDKEFILQALDEGIFFLNSELDLQGDFSESFQNLIDQKVTAGQAFISLLEKRIPDNIIKNTLEFLILMFREDLDEDTILELNPLKMVEFHFENRWGLWTSSKYLAFKFKRIINEGVIVKIIATVKDVTKSVNLSRKLEEVEETTQKQMEWLVSVLCVAPALLNEFLAVSEMEMSEIDKALKDSKVTDNCLPKLNRIIRSVHQIRSNASLLNLSFFAANFKSFERELHKIKEKSDIDGSDFVPAVIHLGELRQMLQDIKDLMQKFKHFSTSLRPTRRFEGGLLIKTMQNLISTLSEEMGKSIEFNCDGFDNSIIPYSYQNIVREFLAILTRLSIVYGIEEPDNRKAANKSPTAKLEIETFSDRRIFGFKLRHDGRLVSIERLLQKSIESTEAKIAEDPKSEGSHQLGSEVIRLLFMPSMTISNLSEARYSREIFGDMEMVKKKLKMHGGKIKITFTSENFCEYTISFPKK
jgi:HPt (histidine-containing phosphotransfer) domain-containing protein